MSCKTCGRPETQTIDASNPPKNLDICQCQPSQAEGRCPRCNHATHDPEGCTAENYNCECFGRTAEAPSGGPSETRIEDAVTLAAYWLHADDKRRRDMWHCDIRKICETLIYLNTGRASMEAELGIAKEAISWAIGWIDGVDGDVSFLKKALGELEKGKM